MEEWRDVPGWEGFYQVSDQGRVRSVDRVTNSVDRFRRPCLRRQRGQLLRAGVSKNGYAMVNFTRPDAKRHYAYVHHLVMAAFEGPCPEGKEVCHNDGVKTNNHFKNLRYGSRSANALDRHIHGTMNLAHGEKHFHAKLDEEKIRWIRANHGKVSMRAMAKRFGVSHKTISSAIRRETWWRVD